ncbi:MAG: transposon-encoded TnpW family protein [Lachnospiraceae bacterium]|nr:transposon-encoded TnpW family protein [Clostridiales bacterium]MBQ6089854.1 transposon-encoded TnpW family protein [Lachnospiraceae bacterium]
MTDNNTNSINREQDFVTVRKKIGKTTFLVKVHFNKDSKETLQKKCERLIADEVRYIDSPEKGGVV